MGNKRPAPDFHPSTPPPPVSKRMRGPSGLPLVTTPPRPAAAPTTPHRTPPQTQPPQPPHAASPRMDRAPPRASPRAPPPSPAPSLPPVGTDGAAASLPVTPARPPRMPRFDRDRANDTATDRKLVQRLNRLSPSEIVALVKDVEQRLRQLTAFEAEEINRAKRLGFSQASRHSSPVAVQPPPLQAAW